MKRIKQLSIWMIALLAITVTNPAWAADTQPPRPGSYSTIVSTQTIITINWTKGNDNVTPQNKLKYVVWWTKKSGGKWSNTDLITNISTYTLTGLEPDTEYIVQVWVYDEAGYGENYGERTVKTKAAADKEKPKPGSYGTITSTANSITLNWTRATDNVTPQNQLRYLVYWGKKSTGGQLDYHTVIGTTTHTLTGLEPNTVYRVEVWVQDKAGNTIGYGIREVQTKAAGGGDGSDIQAPTPGSYGAITSTEHSITLNWTRGSDNVTPQNQLRYLVYYKKKSFIGGYNYATGIATDITTETLTNLEHDTEYKMKVRVFDKADNAVDYGERIFKTKADTEPPKPGSYGPISITANSIWLQWTPATDNATPQEWLRYEVMWKKKSAESWNYSKSYPGKVSHEITGLEPYTEYLVNVQVEDRARKSSWYGRMTLKTLSPADTEKPKSGSYGTITFTDTTITLNWTPGSDDVTPQNRLKYRVYWKKTSTGSTGAWNRSDWVYNEVSYEITGLDPDTEYDVEVRVMDEAYKSVSYGYKTVKTRVADKEKPKPGSYGTITSTANRITLNWTRATDNVTPQNELSYMVYWKKKSGGASRAIGSVDITTWILVGLDPDTEYLVNVEVRDEAGNRSWYGERTVKTQAAGATIAVTGVTLSPASLSLEVGQTGGLTATVAPATATNKKVTWTSSNTAVATVDGSGTVKGIAPGTATITVKTDDGGKTATAAVTVKAATAPTVKVSDVTLNRNTFTVNGDYEEVQLTATVAPSNATDKSLTWSSDNPQVASVDATGLVKIHKKGKARITVTANDGSGRYDACDFNVIMTVGNETVDGLRVYAHGSALYLTLPTAETVHLYHVDGTMVKMLFLPAGDHVEPLPSGVYLVRIGERVTKIVVK